MLNLQHVRSIARSGNRRVRLHLASIKYQFGLLSNCKCNKEVFPSFEGIVRSNAKVMPAE